MLEIWEPGLLTTVQDGGRVGWARYGVPPSGPLDKAAFRAANRLVGNPPDAAGLEITLTGPTLRCSRPSLVAVCGAEFELWAGSIRVPTWHAVFLRAGQWLYFGERRQGARAYLAVDGGMDVPLFLDSRSTYLTGGFGGVEGRALRRGDRLPLGPGALQPSMRAGRAWPASERPPYTSAPTLRVVLGPQDDHFTQAGLETFLSTAYELTPESNRMGARLKGPPIQHRDTTGIVSDGVVIGSVQVPASGQPIVMLADHQTTGGYPKIATVIQADLPLLAQIVPGDYVRFDAVSLAEAQTLCCSSNAAH
jgi:antagonist of KipI